MFRDIVNLINFVRAPAHGALAQLGEHLLCKQGVSGSIPLGSTSLLFSRYEDQIFASLRRRGRRGFAPSLTL